MNRVLLAICLAIAVAGIGWTGWDMFGPGHRPMLQGWDDSYYYFWLPSVVIDHDVDFTNQLLHSRTINPADRDAALAAPRTATGLPANKYPPGWALGSLPFFLAAHLVAPAGATGFEPVYLVAVWLGQALYAVLGLWLAVKILSRYLPRPVAQLAVLGGWLASPLVYYQTARLSMSHSQVFVLAVAVFWLSLKIRDGDSRRRTWLLLGLCSALLVATRNLCVVYLAAPALLVTPRLRSMRAVACLLAGAIGPVAIQLAAWKALYGSWLAYSYGGERFDFRHLHLLEVLFSPRHGWFYWHPLMLVGIVVFAGWAWRRPEGRGWLVSLALVAVLNAAWPMWWLGSSFGQRGFEVPVFFAMLGLGLLYGRCGDHAGWRRTLLAVSALAIAWNLMLFSLFLTQRIPREAPVRYADAARACLRWAEGVR